MSAIEGELSDQAMAPGADLRALEPDRPEQSRNRITEVAGGMRIILHPPRRQTMVDVRLPTDVDNVQPATRTQDTVDLRQRTGLHVVVQVVQHHR